MYSTCLFCTRDMGQNEILETLPVGRRIAFDAAQGRLWVVCRGCEKWNLVPFDTRLETIDACERLFADARLRYSTNHIGIARLAEGLELVRIGAAQRPEFAAWRYGDQFGRRRRRYPATIGVATIGVGAAVVGGHALAAMIGIAGSGGVGYQLVSVAYNAYRDRRIVARIPERDGVGGAVTQRQLKRATITTISPDEWSLDVSLFDRSHAGFAANRKERYVRLWGDHAVEALGRVLPKMNARGGSARTVRDAVDLVSEWPSVDDLMAVRVGLGHLRREKPREDLLKSFPAETLLALEMAAHEGTERAALAGELDLLEREWKAADELAKIADNLAISDEVHERFER